MPTYLMEDASFDLLDVGFDDQTIHLLESSAGGHVGKILVDRGRLKPGASTPDFARARSLRDAKAFDGWKVLAERESDHGGVLVSEIAARFRAEDETMYQRRAHFVIDGSAIAITARGAFAASAEIDAWMDQVLGTLRFRANT